MDKNCNDTEFWVREYGADDLVGLSLFTEEIIIVQCAKGRGSIMLNNVRYQLSSGMNFMMMSADHLYFEKCRDDIRIITVEYSTEFFTFVLHITEREIFEYLFKHNTPDACPPKLLSTANKTIQKISDLYKNQLSTYFTKYLVCLTIAFHFERYDAICRFRRDEQRTADDEQVHKYVARFRMLCNEQHMKERNIKVYAAQLHISTRHLYELVKNATGMSPKQILNFSVITTAKRLLLDRYNTTQEVAYLLHFSDQSNFAQFFKQNTGETPRQFRKRYAKS